MGFEVTLAERIGGSGSNRPNGPALRPEVRALINQKLDFLVAEGGPLSMATEEPLHAQIYAAIDVVTTELNVPISAANFAVLVQELIDERLGHGVLEPLLRDPTITEIMVRRYDHIFVERSGMITASAIRFESETQLRKAIDRMVGQVGRRVDESNPIVDARLLDGSRINAVLPPVAIDGATLTIRKFSPQRLTLDDLVRLQTATPSQAKYLRLAIENRRNIVISGGTGSGKSTTLNALCEFMADSQRIVTIEDSAELNLSHPHVVRLETRPTNSEGLGQIGVRDLVRNALRMRPDRIIIGEVRDSAALDMLQAMNTGHSGSLTTVHANSVSDAMRRLETMCLMSEIQLPLTAIREQLASAIEVVIQQTRLPDGSRRITKISEIISRQDGGYALRDVQIENRQATLGETSAEAEQVRN